MEYSNITDSLEIRGVTGHRINELGEIVINPWSIFPYYSEFYYLSIPMDHF